MNTITPAAIHRPADVPVTRTVRIPWVDVQRIFEEATSQADYVVGLHALALSKIGIDWANVESLGGYFKVSPVDSHRLFDLAIKADRRLAVSSMIGGCWMNYGFSSDSDMLTVSPFALGVQIDRSDVKLSK